MITQVDQGRRLFGVGFDLVVWHSFLPIDDVRRLFGTSSRFIATTRQLRQLVTQFLLFFLGQAAGFSAS
jgi:hypothetical protein